MKEYQVIIPVVASGNIMFYVEAENELEAAQKALKGHWDNPECYETLGWNDDLAKLAAFPTTAEKLVTEELVEET